MLATPTKYFLTAGTGEGETQLTAFDEALLNAGVGNVNLLKVSSILPPAAERLTELHLPPGSLVPIAYGALNSETPGDVISAAVAVAIGDPASYGVIMEFKGHCTREEAAEKVSEMAREAFRKRGLTVSRIQVAASEHCVEKAGCAFAAVVLWYE